MGQAIGVLLGAVLLYSTIVSPLISREEDASVVMRRSAEKADEKTWAGEEAHAQIKLPKRRLILERAPVQYPIFLAAATNALKEEESCKGVNDTDAETFAWGLLGHSLKENGLCKGLPEERCDVSSTGARGPMQFQPATWVTWGRDGDGDGLKNSETLADSAYAAAAYLCELRRKTGSWGHAMCRYYGDNADTCVYERRVRNGINEIKTVLAESPKPSMTLSKANSTSMVR